MDTEDIKANVVGRVVDGKNVIAYVVRYYGSEENKVLSREIFSTMATEGKIANVKAQVYSGKVTLKGVGFELRKLRKYDILGNPLALGYETESEPIVTLVGRIEESGETIGYIAKSSDGNIEDFIKLSKNTVVNLARKRKVTNARAQLSNGVLILRGNGCNLAHLPRVTAE